MSRIGRVFIAGLLAALPLLLTIFITGWLVTLINQYLGPSSTFGRVLISLGMGVHTSAAAPYLIGLAIIVCLIFGLGLLVESRLGIWLNSLVDRLVRRVPLVSQVYDLSRRFVAIVDSKDGDSLKKMSPAWCFSAASQAPPFWRCSPPPSPFSLGAWTILRSSYLRRLSRSAARSFMCRQNGSSPPTAVSTNS